MIIGRFSWNGQRRAQSQPPACTVAIEADSEVIHTRTFIECGVRIMAMCYCALCIEHNCYLGQNAFNFLNLLGFIRRSFASTFSSLSLSLPLSLWLLSFILSFSLASAFFAFLHAGEREIIFSCT